MGAGIKESVQKLEDVIMSFGMYDAKKRSLREFFVDKKLVVPDYQRLYSWDRRNWEDFWNDLVESINMKVPHYYGTVIVKFLSQDSSELYNYEIIDGQQRITTFYLFSLALVSTILRRKLQGSERVGIEDIELEIFKREFIKKGEVFKLELGNLNREFFKQIAGKDCRDLVNQELPFERSNQHLLECYKYFCEKLAVLSNDELKKIFDFVKSDKLFVVEFVVQSEDLAVRIFEVINDRGKPLTYLDKVKSVLMFASQKYLNGALNAKINNVFEDVFKYLDLTISLGTKLGVPYLSAFEEDDLLKILYHYLARWAIERFDFGKVLEYDYDAGVDRIFEDFVKRIIGELQEENTKLRLFIDEFIEDLKGLANAFYTLLEEVEGKCEENKKLYKLILFLEPNIRTWHLLVAAKYKGFLNDELLDLIESMDVRIYKVRGTDPRAGLYNDVISKLKDIKKFPKESFCEFLNKYGNDADFMNNLRKDMYNNKATRYILWELNIGAYIEKALKENNLPTGHVIDFDDCKIELYRNCQVEHIIPQNLNANLNSFGFSDEADYRSKVHKLGNLTLLEEELNKNRKKCGNHIPKDKATKCYPESEIPYNKYFLVAFIQRNNFGKSDIDKFTNDIVKFALKRWKIS